MFVVTYTKRLKTFRYSRTVTYIARQQREREQYGKVYHQQTAPTREWKGTPHTGAAFKDCSMNLATDRSRNM